MTKIIGNEVCGQLAVVPPSIVRGLQTALSNVVLHHAVHITLGQLGTSTPLPDFWLREVPLLAQNHDAIRHVITMRSWCCRQTISTPKGCRHIRGILEH
jgi:hypothetical protein